MVIDADMDKFPTDPPAALLSIARDAVTGPVGLAQLLDVDVHHLARRVPFIADHGFGGFQIAPAIETMTCKDASDSCSGKANANCSGAARRQFEFSLL